MVQKPNPPSIEAPRFPAPDLIRSHLKEKYAWLDEVFLTEEVGGAINITWSAYHLLQKRGQAFTVSIACCSHSQTYNGENM